MTPQPATRRIFSSHRVRLPTARSAMGNRNASVLKCCSTLTAVDAHTRPTCSRMASEQNARFDSKHCAQDDTARHGVRRYARTHAPRNKVAADNETHHGILQQPSARLVLQHQPVYGLDGLGDDDSNDSAAGAVVGVHAQHAVLRAAQCNAGSCHDHRVTSRTTATSHPRTRHDGTTSPRTLKPAIRSSISGSSSHARFARHCTQ